MNRELVINVTSSEISIALCEDKVLVELNKEQCQTGFAVGDIYLGKVRKIMPGLNAAFVNIGHEKDAFIHYLDLGSQFSSLQRVVDSHQPGKRAVKVDTMKLEPSIEKQGKLASYLQVGQTIMVQIAKEAISTKGPRLTSDISLAGRNVVLVPFSTKISITQTQLTCNLLCCREVYFQSCLLLVYLRLGTISRVHIDDIHRLGVLNDKICTTLQRHILCKERLDLFRYIKVVEDWHRTVVQLNDLLQLGVDNFYIVFNLTIQSLIIYCDLREC